MAAASWQCSSAATYTVGDALGWTVPPISTVYSEWASDKTFVVGDILGKKKNVKLIYFINYDYYDLMK